MSDYRVIAPQSGHARFAICALAMAALTIPLLSQGQSPEAPSATLRGTIRDAQGKPVAAVTVRLQAKHETQARVQRTDAGGAYLFSSLPADAYTLRAGMTGDSEAAVEFVLGPKETKGLDLVLAPAKASGAQPDSSRAPAFFDEPHFTVAGVTDTTNLGGHGSDSVVRTREAIAKETAALGKDALADSPPNPPPATEKSVREALLAHPGSAELHHLLADLDERRGNSLEAVHEYQRAAELSPSEANLFDWGSELLMHHAPEPALEVFGKGNRLFPRSVRMLIGLGAAWYSGGGHEQAVRRICEASELNPTDPTPYLFLGKIQSAENTPSDQLVEKFERFARLQPENALASYYYAVSLWKRRKDADSEKSARVESLLEKALRIDPKLGAANLQLGILYAERKDFARAISAYQKAIEADPQMEEAHYRLAQAYRQTGAADKAKAEVQLYGQLSKESAQKIERERHEIRQFVYTLRDPSSAPPQ